MSPIGAVILSILLLSGIMFIGDNYTAIGLSRNVWIGVMGILSLTLVVYEIYHKIMKKKSPDSETAEKE